MIGKGDFTYSRNEKLDVTVGVKFNAGQGQRPPGPEGRRRLRLRQGRPAPTAPSTSASPTPGRREALGQEPLARRRRRPQRREGQQRRRQRAGHHQRVLGLDASWRPTTPRAGTPRACWAWRPTAPSPPPSTRRSSPPSLPPLSARGEGLGVGTNRTPAPGHPPAGSRTRLPVRHRRRPRPQVRHADDRRPGAGPDVDDRGRGRIPVHRPGRHPHGDVDAGPAEPEEVPDHQGPASTPTNTSPTATARPFGPTSAARTATWPWPS